MHNNYFFLRQLTSAIASRTIGKTLIACYSQNKNELILVLASKNEQQVIKTSLLSAFQCCSFPERHSRSGKNSVDLFNGLIGKSVKGLRQFQNERSFSIDFGESEYLLFKMHGSQANVIHIVDDKPVALFRNAIKNDWLLRADQLDREIDWTREGFMKHVSELRTYYSPLGKPAWNHLLAGGFDVRPLEEQWKMMDGLLDRFTEARFYISKNEAASSLVLFPDADMKEVFDDAVEALNHFFTVRSTEITLAQEKASALRITKEKGKSAEQLISKTTERLTFLEHDQPYRVWADLLMAHLDAVTPGAAEVVLPDFTDTTRMITIPLKPRLNVQSNATQYYRKAKNTSIETDLLNKRLTEKQNELSELQIVQRQLEAATDLKEVRKLTGKKGGTSSILFSPGISLPYREILFKGFRIRIGKNASSNDALTLHYSSKDDLWLHACDVPGSHVLIKLEPGKPFPKEVIERAAALAAYYSKRKTETLCPVIVTEKKYVRKKKGAPPGAVVVEREKVLMVEPAGP